MSEGEGVELYYSQRIPRRRKRQLENRNNNKNEQ